MGTRSFIGITNSDGTVEAIYCHWDGYPAGVGATLRKHYLTARKVRRLLSLGDLSILGPTCGSKHDFDSNTSMTTAYHRDRGDELRLPAKYADAEAATRAMVECAGTEYGYVFDPATCRWTYTRRSGEFFPLTDAAD